ncbi:hypothetical protein ACLOJK_026897 [Asimina triloba]
MAGRLADGELLDLDLGPKHQNEYESGSRTLVYRVDAQLPDLGRPALMECGQLAENADADRCPTSCARYQSEDVAASRHRWCAWLLELDGGRHCNRTWLDVACCSLGPARFLPD